MPSKICSYRGCHKIISMREIYCNEHKKLKEKEKKENNKHYDTHIRDKRSTAFYHSDEWLITREDIKHRDNGLCLLCLSNKTIRYMEVVHHIEELKDAWNKRLNKNNLISVCDKCHKLIHAKYKKSNKDKIEMQRKLKFLIG